MCFKPLPGQQLSWQRFFRHQFFSFVVVDTSRTSTTAGLLKRGCQTDADEEEERRDEARRRRSEKNKGADGEAGMKEGGGRNAAVVKECGRNARKDGEVKREKGRLMEASNLQD